MRRLGERMSQKHYSSRSRLEVFANCPREGYIQFCWDGRGIVKRGASVYLSTGQYTHEGLRIVFLWAKAEDTNPPEETVDYACLQAIGAYKDEIRNRGFDLEDGEDRENEQFVVDEQTALVEGFIRSFCLVILPNLLERYKVIDVEREESYEEGNLIMQGRIDVILEERETGDIYIVSFKTSANWDRRQEKANEHDNQGLSETLLLEHRMNQDNETLDLISKSVRIGLTDEQLNNKVAIASNKYLDYISKFRRNDKVMGVLMIYMLKGKRSETSKGSKKWEQNSPLVKAYRKLVGVDYEYAPSLYYEKAENKSGWGRLGKGWESFYTWEEEGGVKEWVRKLASDEITGGRKTLEDLFKIPTAYFRRQEHLDSWWRQSRAIENEIAIKLKQLGRDIRGNDLREKLDYYFPQRRKGCHYPTDCQYLDVCYTDGVFDDPIGSGKFMYRIPHHKLEADEHTRLYQIQDTKENGGQVLEVEKVDDKVGVVEEEEEVIEE